MAYDDFDRQEALKRVMKFLIIWLAFLIAISLLASCRQVEYVTVEKVRIDTTYITKWQKDSVWLHDSIHIKEKGDTVMIEVAGADNEGLPRRNDTLPRSTLQVRLPDRAVP